MQSSFQQTHTQLRISPKIILPASAARGSARAKVGRAYVEMP